MDINRSDNSPETVPGVFRRRIRMIKSDKDMVIAGVEDEFHAFKIVLKHDGHSITSVSGEALRYPLDVCSGATTLLKQFEGIPLSPDCRAIGNVLDSHQHCTHLFDLAGLAIAHASRNEQVRQYDIKIPDPEDDRSLLILERNGLEVLRMLLSGDKIICPEPYIGQRIEHGFSSWVQENIPEQDSREAALVLQRGRFVATGRQQKEAIKKTRSAWRQVPVGVCYSYQPQRISYARRMDNSIRDFSDNTTDLLTFVSQIKDPDH